MPYIAEKYISPLFTDILQQISLAQYKVKWRRLAMSHNVATTSKQLFDSSTYIWSEIALRWKTFESQLIDSLVQISEFHTKLTPSLHV